MRRLGLFVVVLAGVACTDSSGSDGESSTTSESSSTDGTDGTDGTDTGQTETSDSDTTDSDTTETDSTDTDLPEDLFASDLFLNIAHRGGGRLRPEATLLAFEHALAVGSEVIEMDLHATADGVIVVLHDDTVDRTTDGTGAVQDMTLEQIKQLDAGYAFTTDGGRTYPYRDMGVEIPTLEEVLDAFPGRHYLMEIKQSEPSIVDSVEAILVAREIGDRVILASFDDPTIEAVRALNPARRTAMSAEEMIEFNAALDDPNYTPPCGYLQSPWELSSEEVVDRAHALGMKVHPWTVNDEPLMLDLIGRGVDGIMTDDPVLLEAVGG